MSIDLRSLRRNGSPVYIGSPNFVKKILLLGYGYVARRLSRLLRSDGWTIEGTIRDPAKSTALEKGGVAPVVWADGALDGQAIDRADAILISTPPDEDGCPALAASRERILARKGPPGWIGYLSTNGVYGDYGGRWIDETAALLATSARARRRIEAEEKWRALAGAAGAPLTIFRLPGVYGPGRSALDTVREGRAQRIFKKDQVFSRAHVDDIAGAIAASIKSPNAGELFNIADDEPAPPQDVIEFACKLLGVEPPPLTPIEDANLSDMAKSFYADNKRVSNKLMKERLIPALSCPTYREGLKAIFDSENQ